MIASTIETFETPGSLLEFTHNLDPKDALTQIHLRVFPAAYELGLTPVEQDQLLRAAAKKCESNPQTMKGEWKAYLSTRPNEFKMAEAQSFADKLIALVHSRGVQLFHSPEGTAYADILVNGHRETHALHKRGFTNWIAAEAYRELGKAPGRQPLDDALRTLEAQAKFNGPERGIYLRVAEFEGRVYLDLGNPDWSVVEVNPDSWRLVDQSPVRFYRTSNMQALPNPEPGGQLEELLDVLNVDLDEWPLAVGWLIGALNPTGPYPLLILHGEQGSSKSTTARMLKGLVDPSNSALRAEPKDVHSLMIGARNSWVMAFDNLSNIPAWLSDALCRLSTGGGFSTRELYSNDEESILEATRPVMLTGIDELATRGDLLSRAILIHLPVIPQGQRKTEREVWARYEALRPRILGALLDAISTALRRRHEVKLDYLPRMADFTHWVVSAEPSLGLDEGQFLQAYRGNEVAGHTLAIESSPIASALLSFLEGRRVWQGTATDLLVELDHQLGEHTSHPRNWPKNARALSDRLQRLAPNLRAHGIDIETRRTKAARLIHLKTIDPETASPPSSLSLFPSRTQMGGDVSE